MYLPLRKCKNDCKILKTILGPNLCLLKPETARFSTGFRLNNLLMPVVTVVGHRKARVVMHWLLINMPC